MDPFFEVGDGDEHRFFEEVGDNDEDRFFFEDGDDVDRSFEVGDDDEDRPFKKLETEENHDGTSDCPSGSFRGTVVPPPEPTDGRSQEEDTNKTESIDALLAHKFAALTMEERQQVMNDIHCVSEPFPEPPEFVDEKISELSALLKGGSTEGDKKNLRQAYEMAVEQDPEYVEGRSFLLQFLRAGSFDPENAAQRILKHFEQKLTLFGQDKLTKTITLEDMGEEENKLLRVGWCGKLPLRDMSSRSVIYMNPIAIANIQHEIPSISRMRVLMYTILSLVEEEEEQRRGFVLVNINMGENISSFGKEVTKNNAAVIGVLPVKCVAAHFFDASGTFGEHFVLNAPGFNSIDPKTQVRIRIHPIGKYDYKQLHFLLNTHGIPARVIPLREDGQYDLMYHNEYIRARKALETERQQQSDRSRNAPTLSPGPRDVIHGIDNFARSHVGNVKFLSLVEEMFPEYDVIEDRLQRPIIYQRLLDKIHDSGGLFLYKDDDGLWREASHKMAMDKIGNAFRSRRKIIKREEARKLKRTAPSSTRTPDESS